MEKAAECNGRSKLFVILVIAGAFLLRLIGLDSSSLTLNESENALAALRFFSGGSSGQLLYTMPTALLFKLFDDTEFTARLFPALMGALAVFVPLSLRGRYGRRRMLLLSFLLAVDPVLLFWSKRADAVIPSLVLTGAAFAFFVHGKKTAALSCFFIALCGGERCIPAVVLLALGCLCLGKMNGISGSISGAFGKKDIAAAALLWLVFVTACSAFPAGFASFGRGAAESLRPAPAWAYPGAAAVAMAVIVYCGIPLFLFISSAIRMNRYLLPGVTAAGSLLLLLWQGVTALPWITVLLWIGSAGRLAELSEIWNVRKNFGFWLAAGALTGGFSFVYFRAVEVFNQTNGFDAVKIYWNGTEQVLPLTRIGASVLLLLGGLVIIGLILKILLGFSDSLPIRCGLICGLAVICGWGLITNIWNTGGFDRIGDYPASPHLMNSYNLLNGNYTSWQDTPLFEVIGETTAKHGDRSKEIFGYNFIADDVMLEWMLRKESGIRRTAVRPAETASAVLILDRSGASFLEYGFVGTVLTDKISVNWEKFSILDWGKWLLFGNGISSGEAPVTLWVKGNYILSNDEQVN